MLEINRTQGLLSLILWKRFKLVNGMECCDGLFPFHIECCLWMLAVKPQFLGNDSFSFQGRQDAGAGLLFDSVLANILNVMS